MATSSKIIFADRHELAHASLKQMLTIHIHHFEMFCNVLIYTHILQQGGHGVASPLDDL